MAAAPFFPSFRAPYSPFDIFHDGGAARDAPPPAGPNLPGGPCNFVDLSHGPNGPKCGCRRFWSCHIPGTGDRTADQMGWCMCSHHACFHDDAQDTQAMPAPLVEDVPGQENEKPRSNRVPLSPVQDFASFHMPSGLGGAAMDFATLNFSSFASNLGIGADPPQYRSPEPAMDHDSLPDTLSWRNGTPTPGAQTPLPPIPSQCLIPPSQSASTTASSQLRYLKPFRGKGMNTLSSVPQTQGPTGNGFAHTNTGIDTAPVIVNGRHDTGDDASPVLSGAATPKPGPSRFVRTPRSASVVSAGQGTYGLPQDLTDTVQDHEQRLEGLESGSIYNTALEEYSERHEILDVRVSDLETRMDDVERRQNDENTSVASSQHLLRLDEDAMVRFADCAAFTSLEARVNRLEAARLPSYTSPWELEVVFLPFPLKGIWVEAQDFKTGPLPGGRDEGTQLPSTNSRATPLPQPLAAYDEWAGPGHGWLLPRACAPGRMIDQRLRSRGFAKTVQVRGSQAHSVQLAIGNAFMSVLCMMSHPASPGSLCATDFRVDRFLGLKQPWVPLRKVHKDSRLRFLSPGELETPALWTAAFLMESVVMKATGMHRLYITQPEAYLQDNQGILFHSVNSGWAWQKLRELDRVYPDSQASSGSSEVPEGDALEGCWAFSDRLDDPPSARQSSVDPRQTHEEGVSISRMTDESTEQYFTVPSNPTTSMASPVMAREQSPSTQSERKGPRPPYIWTGSVPPLHSPGITSPARSNRRLPSHAPIPSIARHSFQRHSSPLATGHSSPRVSTVANNQAMSKITKMRHRSTRSPSIRPYNTPRYSRGSYSRSPSVPPVVVQHAHTTTTYMTPYSNAPAGHSPRQLSNSRSVRVGEDDDDDHGSSTDPSSNGSDGGIAEDDDADISVYEDKADVLDNLPSQPQGPEDIPRQGIEDNMPDGGAVDINVDGDDDDNSSDASTPSEYPSNQPPWQSSGIGEGREMTSAFEDEDDDETVPNDFAFRENSDGEEEDFEVQAAY